MKSHINPRMHIDLVKLGYFHPKNIEFSVTRFTDSLYIFGTWRCYIEKISRTERTETENDTLWKRSVFFGLEVRRALLCRSLRVEILHAPIQKGLLWNKVTLQIVKRHRQVSISQWKFRERENFQKKRKTVDFRWIFPSIPHK